MHEFLLDRPDKIQIGQETPIRRAEFSTLGVPDTLQFELWREAFAPLVALSAAGGNDGFRAYEWTWNLGGMIVTRFKVSAAFYERTLQHLRADLIDHWCFSCVTRGDLHVTGSRREYRATAGDICLHSLGKPGSGEFSELEMVQVFVSRDLCRNAVSELEAAECSTLNSGLGRLLAEYLRGLERQLPVMKRADIPAVLTATQQMIHACVKPGKDALAQAAGPIEATLLERARQLIQHDLSTLRLTPALLCRELGVSRSRLYRIFEPLGGIASYIRRRRLLTVHAALSNTEDDRSIADIATQYGFMDPAEFSRAFRREFGYRPSDARNLAVPWHLGVQPAAVGGQPASNLTEALRRLQ